MSSSAMSDGRKCKPQCVQFLVHGALS
jgi:hypothetical protein